MNNLIKLFLILFTNVVFAQDVILLQNGDEINAKVTEIGESGIKYKKFSNLDGPVYSKSFNEIFYIKYSSGEKEIYNDKNELKLTSSENISARNKRTLVAGASVIDFTNTFENDDFYSTTSVNFNLGLGGFITRNFVLGASLLHQSASVDGYSNNSDAVTIFGPFIRGYFEDFYSQVTYAINTDVNVFSFGVGYQVFVNDSKSVSLNPTFNYFSRKYDNDITQDGIYIGAGFEIHL